MAPPRQMTSGVGGLTNRDIEVARRYHEATKHSYTSVRAAAHWLDWDNRPLPYKLYPEIAGLALPRDLNLARSPALEALADRAALPADSPLDLDVLTRILFCAGGLTRSKRVGAEDYHFRAAPSAGALYPTEVYVAAAEVDGVEPGLYHFSPGDLKLRGLRRGDWRAAIARAAAGRPSLSGARAIIALSAIFWRSAWKYGARSYRYCFWDAGTLLANLLAAARAERVSTELVTAFTDPEMEALLGFDGEREGAVCLVALGKAANAPAVNPEITPLGLATVALSGEETGYPDLIRMHQASRLGTAAEVAEVASARLDSSLPAASGSVVKPALREPDAGLGLGETILRRGSARSFARAPIAAEDLATIMAVSSGHPAADFPSLTATFLIVNAVEGMEPGAYCYRREGGEFELLKAGNFIGEAGYLCLEQPLGADCSALVCYMTDLERGLRAFGNRAYRDAHLEAGLHGGRVYLAAYALGHGATGLTFYDDDTTAFFAPRATRMIPLLMVAIGVPGSRASG